MSFSRLLKPTKNPDRSPRWYDRNHSPHGSESEATGLQEEFVIASPNVEKSEYDVPQIRPKPRVIGRCDTRCWLKRNSEIPVLDPIRVTLASDRDFIVNDGNMDIPPLYEKLMDWQTRLVILDPGDYNQPLSCKLVATSITEKNGLGISGTPEVVPYQALSYSWGLGARDYVLICNGQPLSIPAQAALALLYLRSKTQSRYIWCDAICINQDNPDEKAVQVRSMFRIFEKAERVIAWLGTPSPECSRLFHALRRVYDSELPRLWHWSEHQPICNHAAFAVGAALMDIFARSWFRRTWVRQEVYAATELILQIGPHRIEFRAFLRGAEYVNKSLRLVFPGVPNIERPSTLNVYDKEYQHAGYGSPGFKPDKPVSYSGYWRQVLSDGSRFQVTDERDRVYGALGILINRHVSRITDAPYNIESLSDKYPVSYREETSVVFQNVIKFLINTTQNLEIFDCFPAQRRSSFLRHDGMPSWTTDWSREVPHAGFHREMKWWDKDHLTPLRQEYSLKGKLRLEGMIVVQRLINLDGQKLITSKEEADMGMNDPLLISHYQDSGSETDSLRISTYPCAFVFSYMIETSTSCQLLNEVVEWKKIGRDFAHHLASDEFIFGYANDHPGVDSLGMQKFRFLLPRETMLDDIIVSLYGSAVLHLLRPIATLEDGGYRCQYIAPVVAFLVGEYEIDRLPVAISNTKRYLHDSGSRNTRVLFELV